MPRPEPGEGPRLTVVIVNWNGREYLRGCLDSLRDSVDQRMCGVTIVDNGSTDDSLAMVRANFEFADVVESPVNLGFARANNIGFFRARTPYVLLLNSDTIVSRDALEGMVSAMDAHPELDVCTCQHVGASGEPQDPFFRFPTLKSEFATMTGMFKWRIVRWLKRKRSGAKGVSGDDEGDPLQVMSVGWVSGACMLLRREPVAEIGCLDERFFFYSEDTDLCLSVRKRGGEIGFIPGITITHFGGGSGSTNYLPILRQWMIARRQFFAKHYGAHTEWCLLVLYAVTGMISLGKWSLLMVFSPRRRAVSRQWMEFWFGFVSRRKREEERRVIGREERKAA